ncbi:MAG TPA: 2-dehydro-3-deoxy-6-phosphogalactonate aldolase [Caulobacteraceae bacterium]|nr:2-dehydro-3-deoxy-6-phosphogalactonate aldolase [Caulobacteraceae bacterium]
MRLVDAIAASPVVAIIRGVTPAEAVDIAQAIYDGGLRAVEVPLNSPSPLESIHLIAEAFEGRMAVGAGTVLDAGDVDAVDNVGGTIIVSPNTNPAVIRRAVELGLDPAPGFSTPTEAFTAVEAGARYLKLFPAVSFGPGYVKQIKAVLPSEVEVWAVGGVGPSSMADWWAAGARGFGLGGEIYRAGQTPEETREKAKAAFEAAAKLQA